MGSQHLCLKWNKHYSSLLEVSAHLLSSEALVDVTLACEGFSLKAHKLVLSACSPFFQSIFVENPCQHPVVIIKGVNFADLRAIVDFMYHGEVSVARDQLAALLETAQMLQIRGLADENGEQMIPESNVHAAGVSNQTVPGAATLQDGDSTPRRKKRRKRHSTGSSESNYSENEQDCSLKTEDGRSPDVINIDEKEGELAIRDVESLSKTPTPVVEQSNQTKTHEGHLPTVVHESTHHSAMTDAEVQNVEVKVEPTDLIDDSMDVEEDRQHHRHEPQHRGNSDSERLPHLPSSFSLTPIATSQESHIPRTVSETRASVHLSKSTCLPSRTPPQGQPSRMIPDHLPRPLPESLSILPVSEPLPARGLPESFCARTASSEICTRSSLHAQEFHPSRPLHQQHPLRSPPDVHPQRTMPEHFSQRMAPEQLHARTMTEQYHPRPGQDHHFRSVQQEGESSALVPFSVSSESSAGSLQDSSSQDVMLINSVPFEEASSSTSAGQSYQHEGAEGTGSGSYMMYGEASGVSAIAGPSGHHLDEHNQQHGSNSDKDIEEWLLPYEEAPIVKRSEKLKRITGYNAFFLEVKAGMPNKSFVAVSKAASEQWNALSTSVREEYLKKANNEGNRGKRLQSANEKKFSCEKCNSLFKRRKHLLEHVSECGQVFQCEICSKEFSRKNGLRKHISTVHYQIRTYECQVCSKKFACHTDLDKHSLIHTGEKPFKCETCGNSFNVKSNLCRHVRNVHCK